MLVKYSVWQKAPRGEACSMDGESNKEGLGAGGPTVPGACLEKSGCGTNLIRYLLSKRGVM